MNAMRKKKKKPAFLLVLRLQLTRRRVSSKSMREQPQWLTAEFGHYYKHRAGGGEMHCQQWTQEEADWSLKDKIKRSVLTLSAFVDGKIAEIDGDKPIKDECLLRDSEIWGLRWCDSYAKRTTKKTQNIILQEILHKIKWAKRIIQ